MPKLFNLNLDNIARAMIASAIATGVYKVAVEPTLNRYVWKSG